MQADLIEDIDTIEKDSEEKIHIAMPDSPTCLCGYVWKENADCTLGDTSCSECSRLFLEWLYG
jgi:hypothetical protein